MALKDIKKYNIRTPFKLKREFWVDIMSSEIFEIWRQLRKMCHFVFCLRNECGSDLRSNEHYLNSALPTELTIWNQHSDQLLIGLLAQLVERCTGIAEVMGLNPAQALIFFPGLIFTTA